MFSAFVLTKNVVCLTWSSVLSGGILESERKKLVALSSSLDTTDQLGHEMRNTIAELEVKASAGL